MRTMIGHKRVWRGMGCYNSVLDVFGVMSEAKVVALEVSFYIFSPDDRMPM